MHAKTASGRRAEVGAAALRPEQVHEFLQAWIRGVLPVLVERTSAIPRPVDALEHGALVIVGGLSGRVELNGKVGIVCKAMDDTTGRVGVRLRRWEDQDKPVSIRRCNLQRCLEGSSAEPALMPVPLLDDGMAMLSLSDQHARLF